MDWVLRIAAIFLVAVVAFLLLLEVIHTVAQRVRDWRDVRDWQGADSAFEESVIAYENSLPEDE